MGNTERIEKISVIDDHSSQNENDEVLRTIENFVDPDSLRLYVKRLMSEVKAANLASTHPPILKGESVENIVRETEKYKKECERT